MIKVFALFVCLFVPVSLQAQTSSDASLSNTSVIKLVKAGFKEKTIIAIIQSRPNRFQLDPDQLIDLKRGGVSENIILAMLSQGGSFEGGDDWDDESFFRSAQNGAADGSTGDSGTNIFGSSGGSRSRSKSRGRTGGNENEGNIVGTATVRIIKPPAEAGSVTRLEKTPTLNNDEVIRLVEAGFSEGTIIKRIENSPVEFDLSPNKLEELHKRRVTDPIIAAMSAAMGDGPAKPNY